jgi:hypothetical protein
MKQLYILFIRNATWNALDSLVTQVFLIGYNYALLNTLGALEYGKITSAFSFLYLIIGVFGGAFQVLCAVFRGNKILLFYTALAQMIIGAFVFMVGMSKIPAFHFFVVSGEGALSMFHGFLLLGVFLVESIKRSVRTFLQIAYKTPFTALVEIAGIVAYLILIRLLYLYNGQITLMSLFACLMSVSVLQLCFLIAELFYSNQFIFIKCSFWKLFLGVQETYFATILVYIFNQIFSFNAIIAFCAICYGAEEAGSLKILSMTSQWLCLTVQKILGISSTAVLSDKEQFTVEQRQRFFQSLVSYWSLGAQAILLIATLLCYFFNAMTHYCLVFALSYIEMGIALYERWYSIQLKAVRLCLFQGIALALAILAGICVRPFSVTFFLTLLLSIRTMLFFVIHIMFYSQRARQSLQFAPE